MGVNGTNRTGGKKKIVKMEHLSWDLNKPLTDEEIHFNLSMRELSAK